jgi:hypothetical protein
MKKWMWIFMAAGLGAAGCDSMHYTDIPEKSGSAKTTVAPKTQANTSAAPVATTPLVDKLTPGDDASEAAHAHKGQNDETGDYNGKIYRHAQDGWFSWEMKVDPALPNELWVNYAGVDQRTFEILIDGERLSNSAQPGSDQDFYDQKFAIPLTMTRGKQKVTVKFQSVGEGGYAGGVFGLQVMRGK